MWKIQMPSGEFLDTAPDFAISFELSNQVFTGSSTDVLPGSFSFPADLPLTAKNKRLLEHPHRVDSAKNWKEYPDTWVYAGGVALFIGTLQIKSATATKASVTIIINPLNQLKDAYLPDIDLGGDRSIGAGTFEEHMKDVARNSDNFDYVFCMVWGWNGFTNDVFYNYFDLTTGDFDESKSVLSPFVRLSYLLRKAFEQYAPGYSFQNDFQGDDVEMQRLYLFYNADARVLTSDSPPTVSIPDTLNLKKHVPRAKITELLKRLIAQWGLGVFTNTFNRQIKLVSLQQVLTREPARDWTRYALKDYIIEPASDSPGYYNYEQPFGLQPDMPDIEGMTLVKSYEDWYDLSRPLTAGYYYLEAENVVFRVNDVGFENFVGYYHRGVRVGEGENYQAGMEALFDSLPVAVAAPRTIGEPSRWNAVDVDGTTKYEWKENKAPLALLLYRGWQEWLEPTHPPQPVAVGNVWKWLENTPTRSQITEDETVLATSKQSLNWFGEFGLYETRHRAWAEMLRNGKHTTQDFIVPLSEIVAFNFEDKIRVGNMDFFCKKIRVEKLVGKGKLLVKAYMISVI